MSTILLGLLLNVLSRNDLRLGLNLLRRSLTSHFGIVSIDILLELEEVGVCLLKFLGHTRLDFSYSIYHILSHVFISE